jgi:hypothetical protein
MLGITNLVRRSALALAATAALGVSLVPSVASAQHRHGHRHHNHGHHAHGHHHSQHHHVRHCKRVCHGHMHYNHGYAQCHGHWHTQCHQH